MSMGFGSRRRGANYRDSDDGSPRATFRQLMPFLLEHKKVLSIVIALSAAGALTTLAQPLVVSQVITVVEAAQPLGNLVWILVGLVMVSAALSGFRHYLLQRTGEGVVLSSRKALVRRMLNLPIAEFDQRRTGDLVSRVGSDTTLLRAVLTQGLVEAVGGTLTFLGAVAAMIYLDGFLFLLTALVVSIAVTAVVTLSRRIRVASRKAQDKVGDLTSSVERAISAVRTVRASNATEREILSVEKDAEGAWKLGLDVAKISALVVPISGIALQVAFLVVLGVGGFRVASGSLPVADLVAFILFLFMMIMPLGQAFGAITSVNQALGALGRIQEIISLPSETELDSVTESIAPASRTKIAIEFSHVTFQYPETAHKTEAEKVLAETLGTHDLESIATGAIPIPRGQSTVLRDVSFTIPVGSKTAIVGPSGAGKSSLLSLLERFYDPQAGSISVFGHDIATLSRDSLRSVFGYVEQDAPVLAGTIKDNLVIGSPDATDSDLSAVLDEVNLTSILDRDPDGLDAQVGEGGVLLSGGERQRLAIARALLQAPPILLLDESTSSLDGPNELLMKTAIDKVSQNRTLVVIAHRLATVVDSDQIIVLKDGKIDAVGSHDELLASSALYKNLAEHQLLV
ncbi:MAG: ABC transporter ATP-binding protein [Microbacteriaceae bacterium]|jgi:ABC-type multidrug transport system fused ATPase/permease subunit|nr:ABC transporter ATP-binding protein [Microbacteriaceae bacterium]